MDNTIKTCEQCNGDLPNKPIRMYISKGKLNNKREILFCSVKCWDKYMNER